MQSTQKHSMKIGTKVTIWILAVILIIGATVAALMYKVYTDGQTEMVSSSSAKVIATAMPQIDGDQIERYTKTLQADAEYPELFAFLSEVNIASEFEYIYLIADLSSDYYTYIGSGSIDKKLENEPFKMGDTDEKSIFGPELNETLTTGVPTQTEAWAYGDMTLISAFYPIKNSKGEIVAAFGADINADAFMEEVNQKMVGVFIQIAMVIVAISIAVYIVSVLFIRRIVAKPLNNLTKTVEHVAEGNIDVSISHSSNDEIGHVIKAFASVVDTLGVLRENAAELRQWATLGDVTYRIEENPKIKGAYHEIVEGMHGIMDTFVDHFHALPIGVCIVDKQYNMLFANDVITKDKGISAKDVKGKKCSDVIACDKCGTQDCPGRHTVESGKSHMADAVIGSNDFKIQTSPVKNHDGQVEGFLEIVIDQTAVMENQREAQKQAEAVAQQVEVARKQAEYQSAEVNNLIRELEKMADGNLTISLKHEPYDKDTKAIYENFSKISNNLETSCDNIKSYISELSESLGEVADKNLDVEITREYLGDFAELRESINHITESLSEVFGEITSATKQVQEGSNRVANTSQSLAQGASEQASAVQQISSMVAQVAQQTKNNAKNASKANAISLEAKLALETGSKSMNEMMEAMEAIKEASNGIAGIIKVIEDIAFQTNILALNAAVEAARAGEHGKGFAVVAEEVRTLAARSASAAKETTEMIDNSLTRVETGSKIASDTSAALERVVSSVINTADVVEKIAQASTEQENAISQIDEGIEQISKVTQINTATAEESAAASQEMSGQSQVLEGMVNEFQIKRPGSRGGKQTLLIGHDNGTKR